MKNYKKIFLAVILVFSSMFMLTGCGKEERIEGKVIDLIDEVNEKLPEEVKIRLMSVELDSDNVLGYLGSEDIEYEEAVASESANSSVAHSVILLRAKKGADMEKLKKQIKESIDPRKWICVGVEDEDVIIKNKGDLVIAIVVENEDNREIIEKGFDNLKES